MSSLKAFAKEAKRKGLVPAPKKVVPKNSLLSTEKVHDSESEEEEESEESSDSEDEPAPKKPAAFLPKANGKTAIKPAPAARTSSSDESSSESSSENEAPTRSAKPALKPKSNGKTAPKSSDSGSDATSSESSDEDDAPAKATKPLSKPQPSGSSTVKASTSSSGSESGSGSTSEESSSESEEEAEALAATAQKKTGVAPPPTKTSLEKHTSISSAQKPVEFTPPTGFKLQSITTSTKASDLLSKSNLKGKQIWHITAPASVSMEAIEKMPWPGAVQDSAVITVNGTSYGFVKETTDHKTQTKIMVPNSSDGGYLSGSKSVESVLHLRQIVKAPGDSRATVPVAKPIRSQPKGLKMRFLPSGFGDGKAGKIGYISDSSSDSSSNEDNLPVAPKFRKPAVFSVDAARASQDASSSSDSGSDSDIEMADAPSQVKPGTPKATPILPPSAGPLKRKHTGEDKTPGKNSSSKSQSTTDSKELKVKKKRSEKPAEDKPLTSTETPGEVPPSKRVKTSNVREPSLPRSSATPIPPPQLKKSISSTSSLAQSANKSTVVPHPSSTPQHAPKSTPIPPPSVPRSKETPIPPPSILRRTSSSVLPSSSPLVQRKQTVNGTTPALPTTALSSQPPETTAPKKKRSKEEKAKAKEEKLKAKRLLT